MKLLILFFTLLSGVVGVPLETSTYVHDDGKNLTLENVKNASFTVSYDNNKGVQNGIYWFRIDKSNNERSILELRNSHVNDAVLYDSNGQLVPKIADTRFPSFFLINRSLKYPLYLKANFPLEAYFPIHNSSEKEYAFNEKISSLSMGFFYGTAIALLIATLIFFFIVKKSEFLFFTILVFTIILSVAGKDNTLNLLGLMTQFSAKLESLGHLGVGLSSTYYMAFYIIIRAHQKWIKYTMIACSCIAILSWISFLVTDSIYMYSLVDLTTLVSIYLLFLLFTQIAKGNTKILFMIIYPINAFILTNVFLLHTFNLALFDVTIFFVCAIAIINFMLIGLLLLISFYKIQKIGLRRKLEIGTYVEQIKELDSYRKIRDADDSYMESLIYQFELENIEIKVLGEISKGRSNDFIRELFSLTDTRLETVTNSIYSKLGVHSSQGVTDLIP